MNHSGDAAEQIVRMSLEGAEVAVRITGTAAKEIAILLIAALKNKNSHLKLKGRARLESMLKSGKALEIYSVRESDLQKFMQGAKEYGIVYCVLRNTKHSPDGLCDIMVKAEDAPKITRLAERFQFATVDKAKIESELVAAKAERTADVQAEKAVGAEPQAPDKNDTEKLLDDLLGTTEGKAEPGKGKEPLDSHPLASGRATVASNPPPQTPPSGPTSGSKSNSAKGTSSKLSLKEELREIKAAQKVKEADTPARDERPPVGKTKNAATTHSQPQGGRKHKSKSKKSKAR